MSTKRQKATAFILENIAAFTPGDDRNAKLMKERLEGLSDEAFEAYMKSLLPSQERQEVLPLYAPNLAETKLQLKTNMELADKLGHNFFQQLWITDPQTGVTYLTPNAHMVVDLIIRRQAQMLVKKSTIPMDNNSIDELSNQPTGASKGGKISFPELQAQLAQELDNTIIEEIKFRGGDEKAFNEMERQLIETGRVSQAELLALNTKVKSTETLAVLLKGMHIGNNLAD